MLALCPRSLSPGPTFPCPRTPVSSTFSLLVTRAPLPVHQRRPDGIVTRATCQWSIRRHGILCFYFVGAATIIKVCEINGGDSATNWCLLDGFSIIFIDLFYLFFDNLGLSIIGWYHLLPSPTLERELLVDLLFYPLLAIILEKFTLTPLSYVKIAVTVPEPNIITIIPF